MFIYRSTTGRGRWLSRWTWLAPLAGMVVVCWFALSGAADGRSAGAATALDAAGALDCAATGGATTVCNPGAEPEPPTTVASFDRAEIEVADDTTPPEAPQAASGFQAAGQDSVAPKAPILRPVETAARLSPTVVLPDQLLRSGAILLDAAPRAPIGDGVRRAAGSHPVPPLAPEHAHAALDFYGQRVVPRAEAVNWDVYQEIAERYAPTLLFHKGEDGKQDEFLPVGVEEMSRNATLKQQLIAYPDKDLTVKPYPEVMGSYLNSQTYLDLNVDSDVARPYITWWRTVRDDYPHVVYAYVTFDRTPEGQAVLVLQYWFFYVYNNGINDHEGDWEGIQLVFDYNSNLDAIRSGATPKWIGYRHHHERTRWNECEAEWTGRPKVYVALGSHASYREADEYWTVWPFDDDANGRGERLSFVAGDYTVTQLKDQSWLLWPGRWGALAGNEIQQGLDWIGTSGPKGPWYQSGFYGPLRGWTVRSCDS